MSVYVCIVCECLCVHVCCVADMHSKTAHIVRLFYLVRYMYLVILLLWSCGLCVYPYVSAFAV